MSNVKRVVVAARVLQQVARELLPQGTLVPLDARVILRREPDRVLVRDVDPRDRRRPVGVHLLRELPRDLDRLDLRREGAVEHPFDQALDTSFEISKDADLTAPLEPRAPRNPTGRQARRLGTRRSTRGGTGRDRPRPRPAGG